MNEAQTLTLEAGKYYRTRDGRKVFVVGFGDPFLNRPFYEVLGRIQGVDSPRSWNAMGFHINGCESGADLVAEWVEPKRIKGFVNLYKGTNPYISGSTYGEVEAHFGSVKFTREECDRVAADHPYKLRIACIEIDVLEGHGLGEAA